MSLTYTNLTATTLKHYEKQLIDNIFRAYPLLERLLSKGQVKEFEGGEKIFIPLEYGTQKDSQEVGGVHTHLPGFSDFITATDICTLRLYQYMTKWKQHIVVSERYTTMYNCENNSLIIIPRN